MELTQGYIESLAPNANANTNAKILAKKFQKMFISEDESLLFGECAGSGKKPYICSMDFIDRENPVARCSCPSRQIPCKHTLALLYAYFDGNTFETGDIPEDILSKRGKIEKRIENKEKKIEEAKATAKEKTIDTKKTKAKINSAIKRIGTQLEGIEVAELIVKNILQTGIAGIDAAMLKNLEQQSKNLGNYYINGIQTAFNEILIEINYQIKSKKEQEYEKTINSILYISSLLKKAKTYLEEKKADEDKLFKLDTTSAIEEQIGHIWTLEELLENNMYIDNAKLIQLAFYSYDDESRREYVDQGFFFCINDGNLYSTYNYRPYKAVKHIKEEDSRFELIETSELYIYPNDNNPRVRWNKYTMQELKSEYIEKIRDSGKSNYAEVIKAVKNQIKNPLSSKNPIHLLKVHDIHLIETENNELQMQIVDEKGVKQILQDRGYVEILSMPLLKGFDKKLIIGNSLLVMFVNDLASGLLVAKPLSIVTDREIVRLIY